MKTLCRFSFKSDGKAPDYIRRMIHDQISNNDGKELLITLEVAKRFSSDSQRAYYFAVLVQGMVDMFAEHTGEFWNKDDMHEWMMINIGGYIKKRRDINGVMVPIRMSYTDLTTIEAEEYHTKIRAFGAQFNYDIPEPNEEPKPRYIAEPLI